MEIIGELSAIGQGVRRTHAARTRVAWPMKSAMNNRRLLADIFHDVDLTAVGPMNSIDIVAQHPECRPDALAKRNLDPRFETAIGLAELGLREQSGRGIVATNFVRA